MTESSTVRENLMTQKDYRPYCGNCFCKFNNPRTSWLMNLNQFGCGCGWVSEFPIDFITRYKEKWNK